MDKALTYLKIFDAPHELPDTAIINHLAKYCDVIHHRRGKFRDKGWEHVMDGAQHYRARIKSPWFVQLKQTKFKDFSRTFQGQKLVFKDSVLFTKSTFLVPLFKTLNSVITYLRYVNSSAMVDDISLGNDNFESEVQK